MAELSSAWQKVKTVNKCVVTTTAEGGEKKEFRIGLNGWLINKKKKMNGIFFPLHFCRSAQADECIFLIDFADRLQLPCNPM